jgi:hypothetical protein
LNVSAPQPVKLTDGTVTTALFRIIFLDFCPLDIYLNLTV